MKIDKIYSVGVEKSGIANQCNNQIDKGIREQAIAMMKADKSNRYISEKLDVNQNTVATWRRDENNKHNY